MSGADFSFDDRTFTNYLASRVVTLSLTINANNLVSQVKGAFAKVAQTFQIPAPQLASVA